MSKKQLDARPSISGSDIWNMLDYNGLAYMTDWYDFHKEGHTYKFSRCAKCAMRQAKAYFS